MTVLWIAVVIAVLVVAGVVLARKGIQARRGCAGWETYVAASRQRFDGIAAAIQADDDASLATLPDEARRALRDQAAQPTPDVLLPVQRALLRYFETVEALTMSEDWPEVPASDSLALSLFHEMDVKKEWKWVDFCANSKPL